jgi:hypothetical protein
MSAAWASTSGVSYEQGLNTTFLAVGALFAPLLICGLVVAMVEFSLSS